MKFPNAAPFQPIAWSLASLGLLAGCAPSVELGPQAQIETDYGGALHFEVRTTPGAKVFGQSGDAIGSMDIKTVDPSGRVLISVPIGGLGEGRQTVTLTVEGSGLLSTKTTKKITFDRRPSFRIGGKPGECTITCTPRKCSGGVIIDEAAGASRWSLKDLPAGATVDTSKRGAGWMGASQHGASWEATRALLGGLRGTRLSKLPTNTTHHGALAIVFSDGVRLEREIACTARQLRDADIVVARAVTGTLLDPKLREAVFDPEDTSPAGHRPSLLAVRAVRVGANHPELQWFGNDVELRQVSAIAIVTNEKPALVNCGTYASKSGITASHKVGTVTATIAVVDPRTGKTTATKKVTPKLPICPQVTTGGDDVAMPSDESVEAALKGFVEKR